MATFRKIGSAFFQDTNGQLAAVGDPNTLRRLQLGEIAATDAPMYAPGAERFASAPTMAPAPTTTPPPTGGITAPFQPTGDGATAAPAPNPADSFNTLMLDLLKRSQGVDNVELLKRRRALEQEQVTRMSDVTPENLRTLSPSQQSAIRSGNTEALSPELAKANEDLARHNANVDNFLRVFDRMKEFGDEYQQNLKAPQSVIDAAKNVIEANPDKMNEVLAGFNDKSRNAIIESLDYTKLAPAGEGFTLGEGEKRFDAAGNQIASGGPKTFAPTSGGGGGLTTYQGVQLRNQIEDNFRQNPEVQSFGRIADFGVLQVIDDFNAGRTSSVTDTVLMRTLAKVTDPPTGVREEEYRTFESSVGALNQFMVLPNKWTGRGRLTDTGRTEMVRLIKDRFEAKKQAYLSQEKYYSDQAASSGLSIPPLYSTATKGKEKDDIDQFLDTVEQAPKAASTNPFKSSLNKLWGY